MIGEYNVDTYVQYCSQAAQRQAPQIQAGIIKAGMQVARTVIFCPPCISAIATACSICCSQADDQMTQWRVRVEYVICIFHTSQAAVLRDCFVIFKHVSPALCKHTD